ncbi:MAG TPA: helix-turn-helix domain-containing protein [Gemmatimonadales bacterium]|nr:helix-turn-helix domain-containing protein [Gemmatimonadales bacterium]
MTGRILEQVNELTHDAQVYLKYGDEQKATMLLTVARKFREILSESGEETLSITQAADISGYDAGHLRKLVQSGKIPNAGRKGKPKIRRRDLPTKPGHSPTVAPSPYLGCASREVIARSIVGKSEAHDGQ